MSNNLLGSLSKKFGNSVAIASVEENPYKTWIDTGSYTLNKAIHPQGLGVTTGIIMEYYGDYSTGKTLLANYLLKNTLKNNGVGILIDTEGAYDVNRAIDLGIDIEKLIIFKPVTYDKDDDSIPLTRKDIEERIVETIKTVHKQYGQGKLLTIVWDSVSVTNSERDLEGKGDQGLNAKEIKGIVRRILPLIVSSNTLLVPISQTYNVISPVPVAEKQIAVGGKGIKFNSHVRIEFEAKRGKAGKVFDEESEFPIGVKLHFEVDKNRIGPPFRHGVIDFLFDKEGKPYLDYYSGYMDYLIAIKAVDDKSIKGWIVVGNDKYRRTDIVKVLKDHPELLTV